MRRSPIDRSGRSLVVALLVVTLLAATAPTVAAAARTTSESPAATPTFTDVPADHPFVTAITWLAEQGIAHGWPDGTFRPARPVTRAEMASFLHRYARPGGPDSCTGPAFVDVPADHPLCVEIAWLATEGITTGAPDGSFHPTDLITRQETAAFLHRLADPSDAATSCPPAPFLDVADALPFCTAIAWLKQVEISIGDGGAFEPAAPVTRQATAAFLLGYEAFDVAPVPSRGCGASTATPVVEERRDLVIGASPRWFLHTVPTAHDGVTPLPLVLDFHGLAEGATVHTVMSESSTFAEQEDFVVAFPHGRFDPVRWDANDQTASNEDLAFVDTIIETLGDELCIDESRVYAMGLSYGAFMTSMLTCARSGTFAAVAPVSGVIAPVPCDQSRPVPVLASHGTEDPILPYAPFPGTVAEWAARNDCAPTPTDTVITAEVTRRTYDCPKDADVEFLIIVGGGHGWSGSLFSQAVAAVVGYTTFDIHATAEAWAFFERFDL